MSYVIKALEFANGSPCPHAGKYLHSFDFDALDGIGYGTFVRDAESAMAFETKQSAFAFWKTTSKVRPTRADGQPNRPLTALSAEIVEVTS